jgi:hypothetical protein
MHSPFRSESDVFRGVVAVVLGTAVAVLIGVLTDAAVGAVAAAVLAGIAIGAVIMAGRGSLPSSIEPRVSGDGSHRILVVANQTVAGKELLEELTSRVEASGPAEILVICPALTRSRLEQLASDTDRARREAEQRLRSSLEALRARGLDARGSVGDEDPLQAAADALAGFGADQVIVSTHPPERSRWLERGVVERLREMLDVPVRHVVVSGAGDGSPVAA